MPRWPAQPPRVDVAGRVFGVAAPLDCAVAAGWVAAISQLGRPSWRIEPADLGRALGNATVGVRVMVSGPEHDVLAAGAACREAGLLDDEVTLFATTTSARRIYCVHCKATSLVTTAVGDVATCSACHRGLHVYEHFSRRSASYLGFQANAESLP